MSPMSKNEIRERLGNIDQIRDIIFGSQIREYESRFNKIESDVLQMQQETRTQFEQLKSSLTAELKTALETLDRKFKLLAVKTQEETGDLQQQVDRLNRKFSTCVQSLDDTIDIQTTLIKEEIVATKGAFQDDIAALRDLVLEEIERRFNQLGESKVSCDDMAETLFALGMRLKGKDMVSSLHTSDDGETNELSSVPLLKATRLPKI